MKIAGIIAEYNPFHNGHQYHIEETKRRTGADYVIAVMSGDFVQRGAPAFLDKYSRTQSALLGGCDLVLELPVIYSTASAEFFAFGAVSLLDQLGICSYLSFGSEEGALEPLLPLADLLLQEPKEYQDLLRAQLKAGLSYPAARQEALRCYVSASSPCELSNDSSNFLKGANNILALEYLKSLKKSCSTMVPFTIQRKNTSYHDKKLHQSISSASAIRNYAFQGKDLSRLASTVPEDTFRSMKEAANYGFPDYDPLTPYLHSTLLREDHLEHYLDWDLELANRISQLAWPTLTYSEIADELKKRNITHSRIYRALLHLILGIEKDSFFSQFERNPVPYARILGFRRESSHLIRKVHDQGQIPLITKPSSIREKIASEDLWVWEKDLTASELYRSICFSSFKKRLPSAYERSPILL